MQMKNRDRALSILVSVLIVSLVLTSSSYNYTEQICKVLRDPITEVTLAGVIHDPIIIGNDSEFSSKASEESWLGEGSVSNPYVIVGFDIDVGGSIGNCITIENTTVHFVIRDCYLEGATQTNNAGIRLWNVTNANIGNNEIFNTSLGIYASANHSVISGNIISATSDTGLSLTQSSNTLIVGNELSSTNGLRVSFSVHIDIEDNIVESQSSYCIRISTSENSSVKGNIANGSTLGGVFLLVCDNIILEDNQCFENTYGIALESSTNTKIYSSHIYENDEGIYLFDSYDTYVMFCNISDNLLYGVREASGSSGSIISWNEFLANPVHIQDETPSSSVYDFNYYDDYTGVDINNDGFGEEPYPIPVVGDFDNHPLVYKPTGVVWSHILTDQIVELGSSLSYDLNVTSAAPIYDWTVNNNQYFNINNEGVVTDKGNLNVGVYNLEVTATNIYGFSATDSFSVTVEDTTNPVWITEVRNRNYNYGNWIEFQIVVWDDSGIVSWTISDNENFTLVDEAYGETGIATITNTHILSPGNYPVMLEAFDNNGNSMSMSFIVTVNVGTIPGIGPGTGTDFGFILSLVGIGIAVVALVFGVCAFSSTRKKPSK